MITIKVLGPGCANCRKLEEVARTAAGLAQVEADIVKVTAMQDTGAAGIDAAAADSPDGQVDGQSSAGGPETPARKDGYPAMFARVVVVRVIAIREGLVRRC